MELPGPRQAAPQWDICKSESSGWSRDLRPIPLAPARNRDRWRPIGWPQGPGIGWSGGAWCPCQLAARGCPSTRNHSPVVGADVSTAARHGRRHGVQRRPSKRNVVAATSSPGAYVRHFQS